MSGGRQRIAVSDARLHHTFIHAAQRLATIDEYAAASGMESFEVLDALKDATEAGQVTCEVEGNTLFLHLNEETCGQASMWTLLRRGNTTSRAHALWRLIRALEAGGWQVAYDPQELQRRWPNLPVQLAVVSHGQLIPVIPYPNASQLAGKDSPLTQHAARHRDNVAIICKTGELETIVTAARSWSLVARVTLDILVLEAPRFWPTLLRAQDNSITPLYYASYDR